MVDQMVGRILARLGIDNDLYQKWGKKNDTSDILNRETWKKPQIVASHLMSGAPGNRDACR